MDTLLGLEEGGGRENSFNNGLASEKYHKGIKRDMDKCTQTESHKNYLHCTNSEILPVYPGHLNVLSIKR